MIEAETKYWNIQWADRIDVDGYSVKGNKKKFEKIVDFLWSVPQYYRLNKLDVGCGPAHHAITITSFIKGFSETWTGIDLSDVAVTHARKYNLNAICGNFLEYDFKQTYDIFESLDLVANKVKILTRDKVRICGNVPLFLSELHNDGGVERSMDINILSDFINRCGCNKLWYEVYGTHGWPFLIFDAEEKDESPATLS
jgi:SAM-dependent methyltransferase